MDIIIEIINVKIQNNVINQLNEGEIKCYDDLSKSIILAKNKLDKFKLENLVGEFNLNLIDSKIIPNFLNDLLTTEDLSYVIEKLTEREISKSEFDKLSDLATKIIKLKLQIYLIFIKICKSRI